MQPRMAPQRYIVDDNRPRRMAWLWLKLFPQIPWYVTGNRMGQYVLESDVRMQEQGAAEHGVGQRVQRAADEGRNGEGHEAGGEDAAWAGRH